MCYHGSLRRKSLYVGWGKGDSELLVLGVPARACIWAPVTSRLSPHVRTCMCENVCVNVYVCMRARALMIGVLSHKIFPGLPKVVPL